MPVLELTDHMPRIALRHRPIQVVGRASGQKSAVFEALLSPLLTQRRSTMASVSCCTYLGLRSNEASFIAASLILGLISPSHLD